MPLFILAALFGVQSVCLAVQPGEKDPPSKIEVKNNRVSLDIKGVYLHEVVRKIAGNAGVKVTIHKEARNKKITAKFSDLDVEHALKKILGDNYVFVFFRDQAKKGDFILKEVMIASGSNASEKRNVITREFKYGYGKDQVAVMLAGEGADYGPPSFAVDDNGNFYIVDIENRRIQVFSEEGHYLSTIPLVYTDTVGGDVYSIPPHDIAFDRAGHIFIHGGGAIYQFDIQGNSIGKTDFPEDATPQNYTNMRIVDSNIYVRDFPQGEVLVGEIKDGILGPPRKENTTIRLSGGGTYFGPNGTTYLLTYTSGTMEFGGGMLEVISKNKTIRKSIVFPLKGKHTTLEGVLGEDAKGNLYIESSRDRSGNNDWITEIYRIDARDDHVDVIGLPNEDVLLSTTRETFVSKDGTVYGFSPMRENWKLHTVPP